MRIIKFQTDSCISCKFLESILDAVKNDYPNIEIERIDALDKTSEELVDKYQVKTVPTVVVIQDDNNEVVLRGLQQCSDLCKIIKDLMENPL